MEIEFPADFVWGVSSSSYQIEGAWNEDGKGLSIWDTFAHDTDKIAGGDTGDVACDHYHRYREDIALMAELGIGAYRFSVSWPRIFPEGRGKVNVKGVDFYDRLIDRLLEANIDPWPCLYHWDLPQALQDKGGWTNRDIAEWFADYSAYVAEHLGDRIERFVVLNEPQVIAIMGHLFGIHAPGLSDLSAFAAATHHLNLAQGTALQRLRQTESRWQLGTVLNVQPVHPVDEGEEHQQPVALFDAAWNRNFLEPLFHGRYPQVTQGMMMPLIHDGDLERIQQPLDFLGLNLYTRVRAQADMQSVIGISQAPPPEGAELTAMGWEVYPDALHEVLLMLKEEYGNPAVFVTENGAAFEDRPGRDGKVNDRERIRFFEGYLQAAQRALQDGVNLKGYLLWTLLDNFEWAEGYDKRFGIVQVDFKTQTRTPKASFDWWQQVMQTNRVPLSEGDS